MVIKKRKQSFSMISSPGCSGDLKADYMYDPKTKRYYHPPSHGQTVVEVFDDLIQKGSDDNDFKILLQADRAFKKLWTDLLTTLSPKFRVGDYVVFPSETATADSRFSLKAPVWIAKQIRSWKKVCDWRNKSNVTYHCTREFVRSDSAEKSFRDENEAVPVEAIEELAAANRVLMRFKKELAAAGVRNATLNHLGKAYKI
jgi:hypothetical protein